MRAGLIADPALTALEALSEHARVASITASNAIEGVHVESERALKIAEGQRGWHQGEHTIWPWVSYLATTLAGAYEDFEQRMADAHRSGGNKQQRVRRHILEDAPAEFRRRDLERALPGISTATIRLALNDLRDQGLIAVEGAGPGARWRRSDD